MPATHQTAHRCVVAAPPGVCYDLVADAGRWPAVFEPTVHVRMLERSGATERFRIWATVNEEVRHWTSARWLDPGARTVRFRQEHGRAPIATMAGSWSFTELPGGRTGVELRHEFTAVDDDPQTVGWITRGVDANSDRELARLRRVAELADTPHEVLFTFDDQVTVPTHAAAGVYDFVYRSDLWPDRLPHVRRVLLLEQPDGVQDMTMETVTGDGSTHTTRSVRVCLPGESILYKQLQPPALLLGHSGSWVFSAAGDVTTVTASHTVLVNPAAVGDLLGAGATLADARGYLRDALGANSTATLRHAVDHAAAAGRAGGVGMVQR